MKIMVFMIGFVGMEIFGSGWEWLIVGWLKRSGKCVFELLKRRVHK